MSEELQQLALVDTLIDNWEGLGVRLGDWSPGAREALAKIAARLGTIRSADALAQAIDDLLDLLEDTPAYDYVQTLISRARLEAIAPPKTREILPMGIGSAVPAESSDARDGTARDAGRSLGRLLVQPTEPVAVKVYFATNRQAGAHWLEPFTGDPGEGLRYGLAEVTIPVGRHRLGRLEHRPWWQVLGKRDDPRRHVVLRSVDTLSQAECGTRLAAEPDARNGLLIFLHGYNVTFEEAVRRAAQLALDMDFPGQAVLFSWPSQGSLLGYSADEERALLSADPFRSFLTSLDAGPWERVHLLAHSMGNRVMLHGLASDRWPSPKLGHVIFVAADVYVALFQQQFPRIAGQASLYSSYVSGRDRALLVSSLLHRGERVGIVDGQPFVMPGLQTIDASAVDTSLLGHSYFADERSLIEDIGRLLATGEDAAGRRLPYEPAWRCWSFRP